MLYKSNFSSLYMCFYHIKLHITFFASLSPALHICWKSSYHIFFKCMLFKSNFYTLYMCYYFIKLYITFFASLSPALDICCGLSPVPLVTTGELDIRSSEGLWKKIEILQSHSNGSITNRYNHQAFHQLINWMIKLHCNMVLWYKKIKLWKWSWYFMIHIPSNTCLPVSLVRRFIDWIKMTCS